MLLGEGSTHYRQTLPASCWWTPAGQPPVIQAADPAHQRCSPLLLTDWVAAVPQQWMLEAQTWRGGGLRRPPPGCITQAMQTEDLLFGSMQQQMMPVHSKAMHGRRTADGILLQAKMLSACFLLEICWRPTHQAQAAIPEQAGSEFGNVVDEGAGGNVVCRQLHVNAASSGGGGIGLDCGVLQG